MKITIQSVLSLFIVLVGFEVMVKAFAMMNEPSDRAVYKGTAVLVALAVFLPFALWRVWRAL